MEITIKEFPLFLLMNCGYSHNRRSDNIYGQIDFAETIGSNDNKYTKEVECSLYVPRRISIGYLCQYTVKAKINDNNRVKYELLDKEELAKGGYSVVDNFEHWRDKSIELIDKVNELLNRIGDENFPKTDHDLRNLVKFV